MHVEITALCDAATDHGGKLNMLGVFDSIYAQQFPLVYPHCAFVCRIRFSHVEQGSHQLRVTFVNADGQALLPPLEAQLNLTFQNRQESAVSNIILNIQGLKVEQPGRYVVDIAIDNRHEMSIPLRVFEVKNNENQPEA